MQKQLEITRSMDPEELRKLGNTEGPCITVCMRLQHGLNQSRIDFQKLKVACRQAEYKLQEAWPDVQATTRKELVSSLYEVESDSDQWGGDGGSLVLLRSPEVFRAFGLRSEPEELVVVGDFFHVFPLLPALEQNAQKFYILALSQNNVRLLRCTSSSSEVVPLPKGTPLSIETWLNTQSPRDSPDARRNREAAEEKEPLGSFTSATDRDKEAQHLSNFLHVINRAVAEVLRGQPHPLVLCGVESERSLYTSINTYPNLCKEGVQGAPDSLKGGEMHARALEAVQDFFAEPARKALQQWERLGGTERAITSFPDVVKAAFEGRISDLFAKDRAQTMGVFDRTVMEMRVQGRQEDLVNAAALQTLAHGGNVFVMQPEHVPGGQQMAALLRF